MIDRLPCDLIYKSFDYDSFSVLRGNRDVSPDRVKRIVQSINNVGYVTPNPILVNKNNEIIDGQGRFEACKQLGLPIYYAIAEDAGVAECISMNIGQTNWRVIDYIKSYADLGNESFQLYLDAINSFKNLRVDELYGIFTNKIITGGWAMTSVRKGMFELTKERYDECIPTMKYIEGLRKEIDAIPGSCRVKTCGIAWVINNTGCDRERLAQKLREQYPVFSPVVDAVPTLFLQQLSDVYNHRLGKNKCLYFDTMYKQFLREN